MIQLKQVCLTFDHVRSIAVDANELVTTGASSGEQVAHTLGLSHTLVAPGTVTVTTDLTVNGDTTLLVTEQVIQQTYRCIGCCW